MEDDQIIELYWNRDENAITETGRKYGAYCRKVALNILQNEEDSEECVNDTWLKNMELHTASQTGKSAPVFSKDHPKSFF